MTDITPIPTLSTLSTINPSPSPSPSPSHSQNTLELPINEKSNYHSVYIIGIIMSIIHIYLIYKTDDTIYRIMLIICLICIIWLLNKNIKINTILDDNGINLIEG
jgi:hypothetical protein